MDDSRLHIMRHSLAHIMAAAIQHLWPEAKFGVGPVIKDGFYYDIDLGDYKISEDDFIKIEKEMKKIIDRGDKFELSELPIDQAIDWAKQNNQPYKEELLNDLKRSGTTISKDLDIDELGLVSDGPAAVEKVSFYKTGDFVDLCRGPHVASTKDVGVFKLMRVAGAYWRGDEKRAQMQRLYGVAFLSQSELDLYLEQQEQAKLRDHRKLGKELDLFAFSPLVGAGLPLFTPRGTVLRDKIGGYSQQLQEKYGYERVAIPHITKTDLYKKSGHYDKYPERFTVTSVESDDEFMMKPMNCPHHAQIFASQPRSYRDLPIRYMENTIVYRDEKTGELHGLSRVRGATQDDAHVFCTIDQIEDEFTAIMNMIREMYDEFGLKWRARLSFRDDSDNYLGDKDLWDKAQAIIEDVAKKMNIEYFIGLGEAAFYGPKIDIMATDALGREWQLATEQLDFVQPQRFDLIYTAEDGSYQHPVMIHKALLGSIERFLSIFIEHTAGWFPFWAAPEQIRILTINDTVLDYVDEIEQVLKNAILMKPLRYNEIRFSRDDRNESLGKKIRESTAWKVPIILIVGPKDKQDRQVSIRTQSGEKKIEFDQLSQFIENMK